ncbi:MAG TPA: ABC transporter permease [Pseudonocardiaceae bacterium]|jgi:ABC-type transport system involved in multi-copper enzyme maturation permease subunit
MSTGTLTEGSAPGGPHAGLAVHLPDDLKVTQWRVVRSEWLKFWSLRSSYITLAAMVLSMVAFGVLFSAVTANRWPVLPAAARLRFDATDTSLRGFELAQLIVGVLGVLIVTGEYSTGMIRATMSAAPTRLPVIWAKIAVFGVVTYVVGTVTAFVSFFVGQALLSSQHIQTTLSAAGVLRAVLGVGLYLTVVGLLGVALGWIIRSTAGGIATLFGLLLVLPALGEALPDSWSQHIVPYLPSDAGQSVTTVHPDPGSLAPWTGFGWFCVYALVGFVLAVVLVRRRDA